MTSLSADVGGSHQSPQTVVIFALTYAGVAVGRIPGLKLNRVGIALLGAIAMMIFAGVSTAEVVSYINWPTVFLLFGFFVISAQLRLSGFYDEVAKGISARLRNPAWFMLVLMLVTGGLSAFLNHDIVCYVFTPIVGTALIRQRLNPVPFLIALAISSNIGAAATLIGNPQNMMIGQVANLDFGRYLLWCIAPVIFALGAAYGIIWLLSRKKQAAAAVEPGEVAYQEYPFNRAHTIKGLVILFIVIGLFFSPLPKEVVALAAAGLHLASNRFKSEDLMGLVEWPILVLFMGLFVVAGTFQSSGYGDHAVQWLARAGFNLDSPINLAVATVGLSNLISNAAAVMLLVKVIDHTHPAMAYVLALANSFGGSLFIMGSVSNLIVIQQARALGIKISFWDFARYGIPVTVAALGGLILWIKLMM